MSFSELFYRKTKHGWEARDRDGHCVSGLTKDMARNQYWLLYGRDSEPKSYGYDMDQVEKKGFQ